MATFIAGVIVGVFATVAVLCYTGMIGIELDDVEEDDDDG